MSLLKAGMCLYECLSLSVTLNESGLERKWTNEETRGKSNFLRVVHHWDDQVSDNGIIGVEEGSISN